MSSDRRAVLLLVAIGVAGGIARLVTTRDGPPGSIAYHSTPASRSSLDSVAARASRLARPLRRGEFIDVDVATQEEIGRLPRIGPGLAARIVANREKDGPFGSLDGLDRVSGVGSSVLEAVEPFAAFSGRAVDRRPSPSAHPSIRPSAKVVSLNTASVAELGQLPGLGPAKAKAIVDDRDRNGPYHSIGDLTRVKGVGPGIVKRLEGRVQVP